MKNLTLCSLAIFLLLILSCNKEERLGKKYTKQLAKTWKWNGQKSYSAKFNNTKDVYNYVDTAISITAINDITVEFMGIRFTREGKLTTTNASPLLKYTGEGMDRFMYFDHEQDTVYCIMGKSQASSIEILTLSGR